MRKPWPPKLATNQFENLLPAHACLNLQLSILPSPLDTKKEQLL